MGNFLNDIIYGKCIIHEKLYKEIIGVTIIRLKLATIRELSPRIETGELSPVTLVESYISRIQKYDSLYNAFITTRYADALKEAEIIERRIRNGIYLGPLDGIPFSLKDIIHVRGIRCTAGSIILRNFAPKKDAFCISRMKSAGAILIGTTNLNEFASGITGINPHYGNSRNPWNRDRISGGSSGGSCVTVSVGMVPFSLGTDTGGSIRVPSAYCGIVGIKPTYDIISREGIINLAPSLDHIGCMTRSSWDAAVVLQY